MLSSILQSRLGLGLAGLVRVTPQTRPAGKSWLDRPATHNPPGVPRTITADLSPGTVCGYLRVLSYNLPPQLKTETRLTRPVYPLLNFSLRVESTRSTRSSRSGHTLSTRISRADACARVWTRALSRTCVASTVSSGALDRLDRQVLVLVMQPPGCATVTPCDRMGVRHTRRNHMSDTETAEQRKSSLAEHNDQLRRNKLQRQVRRAHEWRIQVWAQSELKIREAQSGLAVLGSDPVELFEPNFGDDEMLQHYSTMQITK